MRYFDELVIDGRTYVVEGGSTEPTPAVPANRYELTVRADGSGHGGVEAHVTAPASELAMLGEIPQRSLSGLAHLATGGNGSGTTPASQRFRIRMAEDRRRYPKAWSAWTPADDERLLDGYRSGMDMDQLADELGRKPRAVLSRLVKHGVGGPAEPREGTPS